MEKVADKSASSVGTKSVGTCGGYDHHFVATLSDGSDLMCKICHLPSKQAHLSSCCGHTFCKSCIDNLKATEVYSNACPVCRDSEFPVVQNKQIDRAVRSLHVYCTNEKEGCEWEGEVNDIATHLNCCQYQSVECENNNCGTIVQRQHLTSHMEKECPYRDVKCEHCDLMGSHQFIENEHKNECPKFPLPCPNGCEIESVCREDLNKHRETCHLEMIKCEYYDMGCEIKLLRKDLKDHNRENVEEHLCIVKCELARTKKDLVKAQKDAAIAEKKLVNFQKKFQDNTAETKLIDLQNKFLEHISDAEAQGQENIKKLEEQFYNSISQLHKNCNPWRLKLNALASMSASGVQVVPVILKMKDYSKMKREKEWWHSEYFYSHDKDCKMRLSVYADDNANGYLSVQLSLVYDDSELPLKGSIKLLNQIDDYEHHCIMIDFFDSNNSTVAKNELIVFSEWKDPSFISLNSLNAVSSMCNFVKKDCLFFEVDVETTHVIEDTQQPSSQSSLQSFFPENKGSVSETDLTDSVSSPKVRSHNYCINNHDFVLP